MDEDFFFESNPQLKDVIIFRDQRTEVIVRARKVQPFPHNPDLFIDYTRISAFQTRAPFKTIARKSVGSYDEYATICQSLIAHEWESPYMLIALQED